MKNKELKNIYKLSQIYKNERILKDKLKTKYNINITLKDLKIILNKIPNFYDKKKYNYEFLMYMYIHCTNTQKLILFLKNKYDINISIQQLRRYCSEQNYSKIRKKQSSIKKVSKNDIELIKTLYEQGKSSYEIATLFNYKTHKSITEILKKENVQIRNNKTIGKLKKTYKDFNFETIDSNEKAYFIGLLITDGYVVGNMIGLDLIDEDVINFISKYINNKYTKIKGKNNIKDKYRIKIFGENRVNQCMRFGIYNKKTFSTMGCNLYDKEHIFIPFILRGIIDGDGWIRKDGKEFFICSASKELLIWCKKEMEILGFENLKITYHKNNYNGIYIIRTAKKENIKILKEKIYKESFGMQRKYNRLYGKTN